MYLIMTASVGLVMRITTIPRSFMLPVIIVFCVIGAYGSSNSIFDVWVMLGFGVLGFLLERIGVPLGPFVIGFVLAPLAEAKLRTGLMMTGGSFWPFLQSPVAAAFLLVAVLLLAWSLLSEWKLHRTSQAAPRGP
jgi:putative tricarboxylic transport membrane protein